MCSNWDSFEVVRAVSLSFVELLGFERIRTHHHYVVAEPLQLLGIASKTAIVREGRAPALSKVLDASLHLLRLVKTGSIPVSGRFSAKTSPICGVNIIHRQYLTVHPHILYCVRTRLENCRLYRKDHSDFVGDSRKRDHFVRDTSFTTDLGIRIRRRSTRARLWSFGAPDSRHASTPSGPIPVMMTPTIARPNTSTAGSSSSHPGLTPCMGGPSSRASAPSAVTIMCLPPAAIRASPSAIVSPP